jgi:hypothetical protein
MSRKRAWEVGAGVALLAVLAMLAGIAALRLRQHRLNEALEAALAEPDYERAVALVRQGANVHTTGLGITTLMAAVAVDDLSLARGLLDRGVDHQAAEDDFGMTALYFAVTGDNAEMIRLLVARGANVNEQYPNGDRPIHWPARWGETATVRLLLELGADPTLKGCEELTAFQLARKGKHAATVQVLEAHSSRPRT